MARVVTDPKYEFQWKCPHCFRMIAFVPGDYGWRKDDDEKSGLICPGCTGLIRIPFSELPGWMQDWVRAGAA